MKSEKKFLVTGPTGATGGETVEQLLEKGHAVRALAHREDERSEGLSKLGAEVVFGDLLDMESVRSALRGIYGTYFRISDSTGDRGCNCSICSGCKGGWRRNHRQHVTKVGTRRLPKPCSTSALAIGACV